jgi:hypothetical protein
LISSGASQKESNTNKFKGIDKNKITKKGQRTAKISWDKNSRVELMLETQEDVDIDGMERCKGLCKYTFRQDSGVG